MPRRSVAASDRRLANDMRLLITISEAAAQAGVSRRTMERWIASGSVRYVRLGPHSLRLYPADVAKMKRKRKPKQPSGKRKS